MTKRLETSVKQDSTFLYCPTCRTPRKDIQEAEDAVFQHFHCLNCGKTLGAGILLNLRVICPYCEALVIVS